MADKIVSWGGIDSKGTSGMGVTGSLAVSGSITANNTITFFGRSAQNAPGSIANDSSDNLIIAANQGSGKGTYLGPQNGTSVVTNASNINFYTGNGVATHQMVVGYGSSNSIGNVGIGTSAPSATLHVKGTGTTSSTTALLVQNANGSSSLAVLDNGNVGIGVAAPTAQIHIASQGTGTYLVKAPGINGNPQFEIYRPTDNTTAIKWYDTGATAQGIIDNVSSNTMTMTGNWAIANDGSSLFSTYAGYTKPAIDLYTYVYQYDFNTPLIRARVNTSNIVTNTIFQVNQNGNGYFSGSVGIGIPTPAASLHTVGSNEFTQIVQSTTDVAYTQYYNSATGAGGTNDGLTVGLNSTYGVIYLRENSDLFFGTANTERMRITSTGNLGVGTSSPSARIHILGSGTTSSTTALLVQNANATASFSVKDNGTTTVTGTDTPGIFTVNWGKSNSVTLGSNTANAPIIYLGSLSLTAHPGGSSLSIDPGYIDTTNTGTNTNRPITLAPCVTGNSTGNVILLSSGARTHASRHQPTSGVLNMVMVGGASANQYMDFAPSSGNAEFNSISIVQQINTSGSYSGIVRGLYYSPILTSTTGVIHRAIETAVGDVIINSGSVGIGTVSPSASLHVAGNTIITGSLSVSLTTTGSSENTLTLGPAPGGGTGEGGQLGFNATGGSYLSASFIDVYQDQFRVLKGTNAGSISGLMVINMPTNQTQFLGPVTASAYSGLPNDYLYATRSGSNQTVGSAWANTDIIFNNVVVSKGISFNTSTGVASLTGGKVYRVTARLAWSAAAAYNLQFSCYTSANTKIGPDVELVQSTNGSNNISDGTLEFIYAPSGNTDIKIRCTGNNTALSGEQIRADLNTQFIIQQIA